jgi:hypothetical protein
VVSSESVFVAGRAYERTGPAAAHEIALTRELVERGAHRQARDAEIDAELPLRGNRAADAELLDQLEHLVAGVTLLGDALRGSGHA